jgi:hypothetical protein
VNKLAVNNMHKIGLKGINSGFTHMHATQFDSLGDPAGARDHFPPAILRLSNELSLILFRRQEKRLLLQSPTC